jgi:ParB family chromosome partitioning protein
MCPAMAANIREKTKPRLKNLDGLFNINDGVNPLDIVTPVLENQSHYGRSVTMVAIGELAPFKGHPFRLYEGERLDDMVASIRTNGVLVPIIVRRIRTALEIMAGHNRVNAAKLAGLEKVPAIVFVDVSDEDAMVYVVETNLLQRSFSDMSHTEKAAVIALHHSKMFSQGKRNDILEQIKMLENPDEQKENETLSQTGTKLRTYDRIGESYSLSRNTIARYLRLQQLIQSLKSKVDNNDIPFVAAVTLSFLKEAEQELVADCMERNAFVVDMKRADALRLFSEKGKLDGESVYRILSGETTPKPNRTPTVKVGRAVYTKYFKPNQPAREIQSIVEQALELFFNQS